MNGLYSNPNLLYTDIYTQISIAPTTLNKLDGEVSEMNSPIMFEKNVF